VSDQPGEEKIAVEVNGWRILFRVRTLAYLLAALGVGGGATAMARLVGVATTEDVKVLAAKAEAAQAKIEPRVEVLETTTAKHVEVLEKLTPAVAELRESSFDDRAERLADKASDPIRDARRSREIWKSVKARAKANLEAGKPVRDGLETYLE